MRTRQRAEGCRQRFTYVDYVAKIVLGACLPKYFNLDQLPPCPPSQTGLLQLPVKPEPMEGYIKKKARNFPYSIQNRRFSLRDARLEYYADKTLKGTLSQVLSLEVSEQQGATVHMLVHGTDRDILLQFSNQDDVKLWTDALNRWGGCVLFAWKCVLVYYHVLTSLGLPFNFPFACAGILHGTISNSNYKTRVSAMISSRGSASLSH